MSKPVLSIGIIFKNEIRCLERCLRSLQPLRDAIDCELIMADTGSTDGSREVAAKYADILFDFHWIDDFSAARNAVMDLCSGTWYFSIDADEWLDEDIRELVAFLNMRDKQPVDVATIREFNYYTYDLHGGYAVFSAQRLLRMSTGIRFTGAIHETWHVWGHNRASMFGTVLHHDGYVGLMAEEGTEKRKRNLALLREKLSEEPNNLRTRMQFIECGSLEADFDDLLRDSVAMIQDKVSGWDSYGPSIMRYAVCIARLRAYPEMEEWLELAKTWFPDALCTRIDTAYEATLYYQDKQNFERCLYWAEIYQNGYECFQRGEVDLHEQMVTAMRMATPLNEASIKVILARAYFDNGHPEMCVKTLADLNFEVLDGVWIDNLLETLQLLHFRSGEDTAPLITAFWKGISAPDPDKKSAQNRISRFVKVGSAAFTSEYHKKEDLESFQRRVYTLFRPLVGDCILGTAAAILDSEDADEIANWLGTVECWDELPTAALVHAVKMGTAFPLPEHSLPVEGLDDIVSRLARDQEELHTVLRLAAEKDFTGNWQSLTWVRGLALAAVRTYDWQDEETGMYLSRTFAGVERAFITGCYTPEVLQEENLLVLPSLHRFGWHCAHAFQALDGGDPTGYTRYLRVGLSTCEGMKDMVDFLTNHTPQLRNLPKELSELADKVRAMLSVYSPDDPAVAAIKQSPAYQKVAYLIEN